MKQTPKPGKAMPPPKSALSKPTFKPMPKLTAKRMMKSKKGY